MNIYPPGSWRDKTSTIILAQRLLQESVNYRIIITHSNFDSKNPDARQMENDRMIMSDRRLINYFYYLDQILISSVAFTKVIYRFRKGKKEALI